MNINLVGTVTLSQHLASHTEQETALQLGLTKAAIYQMSGNERDIYLKQIAGRWFYLEIKDFQRGAGGKKKERSKLRRSYLRSSNISASI